MHVHVEQQYDKGAFYQAAGVPAEMEQQYEQVVTCSLLTTTKTGVDLSLPLSNFTLLERGELLAGRPSADLSFRLNKLVVALEVPASVMDNSGQSTIERTTIILHLTDERYYAGASLKWGQLILHSDLSSWITPGERAVLKEMIGFRCPKIKNARGSIIEVDAGIHGSTVQPTTVAERAPATLLSNQRTAFIGGVSAQRNAPMRGSQSLGKRSKILHRSS